MRKLKFRLWDKKQGKIINYEEMQISIVEGKIQIADILDFCRAVEDFELMQFTGLKDKNGKEIYEGDICLVSLKYFDIKNEKSKVIFKDGCFCFQYGFSDDYVKTYNAWDVNSIEVIGNIYEDGELNA